jgi:leucyl aminopeptidase
VSPRLLLPGAQRGIPSARTSGVPLHPSCEDDTKSDIAAIRNAIEAPNPGDRHGAQCIGSFLQPATRWAHRDVAD